NGLGAGAPPLASKQGARWGVGEVCCTTYNHVSPPKTKTCAGTPLPRNMANKARPVPPSSNHTRRGNIAPCDGSVRFVTNSINLFTWRALGTRNGNEVVTDF